MGDSFTTFGILNGIFGDIFGSIGIFRIFGGFVGDFWDPERDF